MKVLPESINELKKTRMFSKDSAPEQLQKDHKTASGIWGLITIVSGSLEYVIVGDSTYTLSPEIPGVIEPEQVHYLRLEEPVEFYLTFYKNDNAIA